MSAPIYGDDCYYSYEDYNYLCLNCEKRLDEIGTLFCCDDCEIFYHAF